MADEFNQTDLITPINESIILLPSSSRTGSTSSTDQTNLYSRGLIVFISVTVAPGGVNITPTIRGIDPISGFLYAILQGPAIAVASNIPTILTVFPSIPSVANVSENALLPINWRLSVIQSAAIAMTYSVAANLLV